MISKHTLLLQSLILKNFATFEFQEVHFDKGFNAIIGETGTGKSLILDALQILLGQRADKKLIRKNSDFALIEANFHCTNPQVKLFFDKIGHPLEDDEISIKRLIYTSGKTKSFLNYIPCNLHTLIDFSRNFIDLVGQFENQKLLSDDYQLFLLDTFSKIEILVREYHKEFKELRFLQKELLKYKDNEFSRCQKIDFLKFQMQEISQLNPSVQDEDELNLKKKSFLNMEKKKKIIHDILELLSNNDHNNILTNLKKVIQISHKSSDLISQELISKLEESYANIEEISFLMSKDINEDENDLHLEQIIERLDLYQKLKRKYGGTTQSLVQMKDDIQNELEILQNLDSKITEVSKSIKIQEEKTLNLAIKIFNIRTQKAYEISSKLTSFVRQLNMNGATIRIELIRKEQLDENGISQIQFLAETNPGEGYFRIKDIASGGELSRILLAFRQVLAVKDSISIFLFDEIDTGIGGETALRIGKALLKVATNSQVIAITHLPQIAHYADKLIVVSKEFSYENNKARTKSAIKEVSGKFKREEVMNMVPLE